MQINTITKYYLTPIRMTPAKINKSFVTLRETGILTHVDKI